jgi:DNA-binding YbaB/EbfC family protein
MSNSVTDILKQAQALQSKLAELQAEAEKKTVEASAGGGMVTATANGKLQLLSVHIEPQVFAAGDREMLEDLVVAAVNEAIRKAQQTMAEAMSKMTGGLKIPGFGV